MSEEKNEKMKDPLKDPAIILLVAIVILAVIGTHRMQIEAWFYDNMLSLVFFGVVACVGLGYLIRWRIRKNNKQYFERKQRMQTMRPNYNRHDYYTRSRDNE